MLYINDIYTSSDKLSSYLFASYFVGKDQLWHVSKVFLVNLNLNFKDILVHSRNHTFP